MKAKARVTINLEISVDSVWGADCPISQIQKQAKDSAKGMLHKLFDKQPDMKTIGDMKVTAIIIDE